MRVIDLTQEAEHWLTPLSPAAFTAWLSDAPPAIQVGFSSLGIGTTDPGWEEFVAARLALLAPIRDKVANEDRRARWRAIAIKTATRAERIIGHALTDIDVILLVGLGFSNAIQGWWQGHGLAFVFVEHFLGAETSDGLLGLGDDDLGIWIAHEVGHAVRYTTLPAVSSLFSPTPTSDPFAFWRRLDHIPLMERLADEGYATQFASLAFPNAPRHTLLGMTPQQVEWLDSYGDEVLGRRMSAWDMASWHPAASWLSESLYGSPGDVPPPWSIDRPPARWGYHAGWKIATGTSQAPP